MRSKASVEKRADEDVWGGGRRTSLRGASAVEDIPLTASRQLDVDRFGGWARNFAILAAGLVVFIHAGRPDMPGAVNWWSYRLLAWGVCECAVPGFFLLSGFFLAGHFGEPGWWRCAVSGRIRTLLVPYLVWGFAYAVATLALPAWTGLQSDSWPSGGDGWGDWLIQGLGLDPFRFPRLVPLWYVRCLFALILLSPILWRFARRFGWWAPLPFILLNQVLLAMTDPMSGWPYIFFCGPLSLRGTAYFLAGVLLRRHGTPPGFRTCPPWRVTLPLAAGLVMSGHVLTHAGIQGPAGCCQAVAVPVLLAASWRLLPSVRGPSWLVSAAFPVFLLHLFNLHAVKLVLPFDRSEWWGYPLRGVLVLVLSLGETWFIRLSPVLARFLFGGR